MKINNKEKLIKHIKLHKYNLLSKYETNINDKELNIIINALNIKSRYKRIKYIVNEGINIIDNYYKECNLCKFKDNKCICHRTINKDYINGCCRKCIYQSNNGCTTKNVACKLYNCSYVDYNGKNKLNFNDINLFKLLNPYQRYILKNDYFTKTEDVIIDLYVGPICFLLRFIYRYLVKRVIR